MDLRTRLEYEQKLLEDREKETKEQLQEVRNQEELEPERDANAVETRKLLEEAGIRALPFYKRWNSPINWMRQHVQGWKLSCRKWEF